MTAVTLPPDLSLAASVATRLDVLGFCATVRKAALGAGFSVREVGELSLVVAELGSNAVVHGRGGALTVLVQPRGWQVAAVDHGPGFTAAVLADAGRSDHLGPDGVRAPGDGQRSFGSGLAAVRRLASSLSLRNTALGARAVASRDLSSQSSHPQQSEEQ